MTVEELVDQIQDFQYLTAKEQVKLISFFAVVVNKKDFFTASDIKKEFEELNLPTPSNISRDLNSFCEKKPPILIKNKKGYAFHRNTKKDLEELYLGTAHKRAISTSLRELLVKVKGKEQSIFLEEAISCFEIKAFRAAIVMTWLLTLDTIYEYILTNKVTEFNSAIQAHGKYKKIVLTVKDQFTEITKESDFIEICRCGKIITNDIKKILDDALNFRNTCAHPNSIIVQESKAISIIEDLVNNVVKKFQ